MVSVRALLATLLVGQALATLLAGMEDPDGIILGVITKTKYVDSTEGTTSKLNPRKYFDADANVGLNVNWIKKRSVSTSVVDHTTSTTTASTSTLPTITIVQTETSYSATVTQTVTQASPTPSTTSSTTSSATTPGITPSTTPSTTTSSAVSSPTFCSDAQSSYCGNYGDGCSCSLALDYTNAYCWDTGACINCASDTDCPAGSRCAFDGDNLCGNPNGTYCLDNNQACGSGTPPIRSVKRALEKIFEEAARRSQRGRNGRTVTS